MSERLQITDDALRAAFAARRRPHWPESFEAAMADQLYSRLVRIVAVQTAREALRRQQAAQRRAATCRPRAARAAPGIDLKRRASGDTDE